MTMPAIAPPESPPPPVLAVAFAGPVVAGVWKAMVVVGETVWVTITPLIVVGRAGMVPTTPAVVKPPLPATTH